MGAWPQRELKMSKKNICSSLVLGFVCQLSTVCWADIPPYHPPYPVQRHSSEKPKEPKADKSDKSKPSADKSADKDTKTSAANPTN